MARTTSKLAGTKTTKLSTNGESHNLKAVLAALDRSQAVIEFDSNGTVLTANGNFLKTLGYNLEEIQGKHHRIFCEPHFANSADYKSFWEKLGRGEYDSGEYKRISKFGEEIWIQATYNPVVDQNGKVQKIIKFATVITAQKNLTAELKGKTDAIGKSQAVIEFNMDGTIQTANENFLKTVGYDL